MLSLRKRGRGFYADLWNGELRVRGPLGTRDQDAARRLVHKLEIAISEGSASTLWPELRTLLPRVTFLRFADLVGLKEQQEPTWNHLQNTFTSHMDQRVGIGRLQSSTKYRYEVTLREFGTFLEERRIGLLKDVTKLVVESFKVWRVERIKKKKFARGATGLALDAAILHRVFAFAVENEMVVKNPVRMEGRPGDNPQRGAQPFSATDLSKLRDHVAQDRLTFLLLRWTGLRGSDAVRLAWDEVHFDRKEIERVTQKRKKRVIIPIHSELLFSLEVEHAQRKPESSDRVLMNPLTNKPLTRPRLYQRMLALGKRAGVSNAHPHRFRDTLAVDMLVRGASPYDVAKMLGDTIETVEKHYTPFVKELRERVRMLLETGTGLENLPQNPAESPQNAVKKAN